MTRMTRPTRTNQTSLQRLVQAQIERVDQRVSGGGNVYAAEAVEVRKAARAIAGLQAQLKLGPFQGQVGHLKSKPQFLLQFATDTGAVAVLKIYGQQRVGEAETQVAWRAEGVPVVDVIDHGHDPVTWLLMKPLDVDPTFLANPQRHDIEGATAELAALMRPAHRVGTRLSRSGFQQLRDAIPYHLSAVLAALQRHGYDVSSDSQQAVLKNLSSSPSPTLLHGDLGHGNVIRDSGTGLLHVLDARGYVGPAEFDAARWSARLGGAAESRDLLRIWLNTDPTLDGELAEALLGLELLMEAGVRELVKDERSEDAQYPDGATVQLLRSADQLNTRD